jgi:hypothetical protein
MKILSLGLACIAALSASKAAAMETELQQGPDEVVAGGELLNIHYSHLVNRHDDVTGHGFVNLRKWDVGLHLDAYMAVDGKDNENPEVGTFETTEITGRVDYLMEIPDYVQVLPFVEVTAFPNVTGKAPFYLLGIESWYMLPWEGIEIGGSAAYNLQDETDPPGQEHHWIGAVGAREFFQDAPLDLAFWQVVNLGSRSYHEITSGTDKQGFTTLNLGAKATLPLPWEDMWTFLRLEGNWWINGDDRDSVEAAGRDASEVVIGIGVEYRAK